MFPISSYYLKPYSQGKYVTIGSGNGHVLNRWQALIWSFVQLVVLRFLFQQASVCWILSVIRGMVGFSATTPSQLASQFPCLDFNPLRSQDTFLLLVRIASGKGLPPNRLQVLIWTNIDPSIPCRWAWGCWMLLNSSNDILGFSRFTLFIPTPLKYCPFSF